MLLGLKKLSPQHEYSNFETLNGYHPLKDHVPESCVLYKARKLNKGKVGYFNYSLAKEMGLISQDHPHTLNPDLEKTLISTFSIQIINEYDDLHNLKVSPSDLLPNTYIASRYLQLQHKDKNGRTSGDGRGVWNGVIEFNGKMWDVSSRGTGVTCLAPGSVKANKPLETGNEDHGYGCGKAEIDELYTSALMAESMHLQGIATERVLCIVDFEDGYGIGVRAAKNLLRPAHAFLYLRQNRLTELKKTIDYTIHRHNKNEKNKIKNYDDFTIHIADSFAKFCATLDSHYIFAWLDWDGDNVLIESGIIDYGSIRQFGIRHDAYRYDDVERFSTNLNEQKQKASQIVQTFIQACDYLKTSEKKAIKNFNNHPLLKRFEKTFENYRNDAILYKLGLNRAQRNQVQNQKPQLVKEFIKHYKIVESFKTTQSYVEVADGINKPAFFNMKKYLRSVTQAHADQTPLSENFLYDEMLSSFVEKTDNIRKPLHLMPLKNLLTVTQKILLYCANNNKTILNKIASRAHYLNRDTILTGNAVIEIVNEILKKNKKKHLVPNIQAHIDHFIATYVHTPEVAHNIKFKKEIESNQTIKQPAKLIYLVKKHCEDI